MLYLCVLVRIGKFVIIETLHWLRDRMWMHLTFTYQVSFIYTENHSWHNVLGCLYNKSSLFFSDGFHHLHFTCWNGSWHSKKVTNSSFSHLFYDSENLFVWDELNVCMYWFCAQVQSRGPRPLCQHCSRVGHHWGLGDVAEFISAHSTHRPLHLWSGCLQWIQICWVNKPQMRIFLIFLI